MSVPDKKLVLKLSDLNSEDLTLDMLEVLTEPDKFRVSAFKEFMDRYSNWTAAEVGRITQGELKDVARQLGDALKSAGVPKAKAPNSRRGRASRPR